jgi:hypothetical protein
VDDIIELETQVVRLERDLRGADEITEAPEAMFRGTARNEVGDLAFSAELLAKGLEPTLVTDNAFRRVVVETRAEHVA